MSGGDINNVYKIKTSQDTYVLKVNHKDSFPKMFEMESLGLTNISDIGVKSPRVINTFTEDNFQFLLLEYIEEEPLLPVFWKNFALDLARIHKTSNELFGLSYDNYIGSLNQVNKHEKSWESFFVNHRMLPLIHQAIDRKLLNKSHLNLFENLFIKLNDIFPKEKPSFVHGDLWSGNLMKGKNQTPVFIDPSIYFGNREMDIAMTQMFGGFDNSYIEYYNEIYPLERNWEERIEIHNLYPNLVHLLLFGTSYLPGIERVIGKF